MVTSLRVFFLIALTQVCFGSDDHLSLGGITLDLDEGSVISILGEPNSREEILDFINLIFKYEELDIYFSGQFIVGAFTTSPNICTFEGVCPGSSIDKAVGIYGQYHEKSEDLYEFYPNIDLTCWYRMGVMISKVTSIEIVCQP